MEQQKKSLLHTLIQRCMACGPEESSTPNPLCLFPHHNSIGPSTQFVELTGIRFIGLGAMVDELSAKERVYDTLEVFRTEPDRLLRVGYFFGGTPGATTTEGSREERRRRNGTNTSMDDEDKAVPCRSSSSASDCEPADEPKKNHPLLSVPVSVWERECTDETSMSVAVQRTISLVRQKAFGALVDELTRQYHTECCRTTTRSPSNPLSFHRAGIIAHNLGVAKVLAGQSDETSTEQRHPTTGTTSIELFQQAIQLKQAAALDAEEIALSWEQLGIQQFAHEDFASAKTCFQTAHSLRGDRSIEHLGMTLNNMACCDFQMGDSTKALERLTEAKDILLQPHQQQHDLDLLHVAIVYGNCGYLQLALKQYETAKETLEEALLIQQSVLDDDDHRCVRDTLSNLEFSNAFHS